MILAALAAALAADFTIEPLKEPPPKDLSPPLREILQHEGIRLLDKEAKPLLDLWLRKEIPRKREEGEKPSGVKFPEMEEGTFLGALRTHRKHVDFRDTTIPQGLFTLRYGIQPVDGNHVGVSESRDFVLLCPVAEDAKPEPIEGKTLERLSSKVSGSKHPSLLYLLPMQGDRVLPALVADSEKEWRILDLRVPFAGEKEKSLRLGLVLVGTAPPF